MTRTLITLTARQLLGRKRTLLVGVVLTLPIVIALVTRNSDSYGVEPTSVPALDVGGGLIYTLLLPLVALIFGTAAIGAEIEDGTAVFLLSKPISRWRVIAAKVGVAAASTVLLVVPVIVATTWILHQSPTADGLMGGMALGATAAAILYAAVFVALSTVTTRALIFGLVYVFVWETFATSLFSALRWVSIREIGGGWSDAIISITDTAIYDPQLTTQSAVIGSLVAFSAALAIAVRSLKRFEIGERA